MRAKYPEDKEKVWNLACKYLVAGKEYKYYKIERVEPTNEIIRTNIKGKQNFCIFQQSTSQISKSTVTNKEHDLQQTHMLVSKDQVPSV